MTLTTTQKVYIGLGVAVTAGLVYYFVTKKPTATLVESKDATGKLSISQMKAAIIANGIKDGASKADMEKSVEVLTDAQLQELYADLPKSTTPVASAKKQLTQAEADALVAKIVKQRKTDMLIKVQKGYVSPVVDWIKELTAGGYVFSNDKAVKQTASNQVVLGGNPLIIQSKEK